MPSDECKPEHFFECTQCGECCRGYGGTYVSPTDIAALADYLGLAQDDVRSRYCIFSGSKMLLAQRPDGFCVFWDRNCTIHPVKPLMCRRWPFIPSLLMDVANWRIMADSCPGIKKEAGPRDLLAHVAAYLRSEKQPPA